MDQATLGTIVSLLVRKCLDTEKIVMAVAALVKAKGLITEAEFERALLCVDETRQDLSRRVDQPLSETLAELLREFEGPKQ